MSPLGQRFFYGTILLGGTLLLLAVDYFTETSYGFLGLCLGFLAVGWLEFVAMTGICQVVPRPLTLVLLLALCAGDWAFLSFGSSAQLQAFLVAVPLLLFFVPLLSSFRSAPVRSALSEVGVVCGGLVYLLCPIMAFLHLRLEHKEGLTWAVLVILLVKGNDIGAYLTGRFFGRTPLSSISPKKTREGSAGGLLLGTVVALFFSNLLPGPDLFSWQAALCVGLCGGVAGQLGDLAESYLKRSCTVKDSGKLIPGFGGALDLMDSVLLGAPVVYIVSQLAVR